MEISDQQLESMLVRAQKLSPRRRFSLSGCVVWILASIMFIVFVAALLPKIAETYPVPILSSMFVTPQAVFSTPVEAPQKPVEARGEAQTQLTPFWRTPAPVISGEMATVEPTSTPSSFYTPEESTAYAVTATAFIEDVPTAPPAFVAYTNEQCQDVEKVAQSWMLQQMCGGQK